MKSILIALALVSTGALAQSNYYESRNIGSMTNPVYTTPVNQPNGYYYDKNTKTYYKPKSINQNLSGYTGQGTLSYTYDTSRYAPRSLRIN